MNEKATGRPHRGRPLTIVLSAEQRREMTVLVIDGAEVAGEDGVREDVEDEMRL